MPRSLIAALLTAGFSPYRHQPRRWRRLTDTWALEEVTINDYGQVTICTYPAGNMESGAPLYATKMICSLETALDMASRGEL